MESNQHPQRVLMVSAEAPTFLARCLEELGCEVSLARTAAQARERLATAPVDVVMCAADLPDGDPLTFLQSLDDACPGLAVLIRDEDEDDADLEAAAVDVGYAGSIPRRRFAIDDVEALFAAHHHRLGRECGNASDSSEDYWS